MRMFRRDRAVLLTCALIIGSSPRSAAAQAEPLVRYDPDRPSATFHQSRRDAVRETFADGSVVLVLGAPVHTRQNDVAFDYRQSSDLLYLTGMEEPASALLLIPGGAEIDGRAVSEVLFVPPRDVQREAWEGRRLGAGRAAEELGIELTLSNDRFEDVLGHVLEARTLFTLPVPEGAESGSALQDQVMAVRAAMEMEEAAGDTTDTRALRQTLNELREIKTEEELEYLGRAVDITVEAVREALRSMEPGMYEYEIEAVIEYVFHRMGAESPGYPSIVGSGENTVILHYQSNRRRTETGDLILMDVGAEYLGYTADVTRTVPVNGVFSPEQRVIYEIVLAGQKSAIAAARPGASFRDPHRAAAAVMAESLMKLGLIAEPAQLGRFFFHGTSHYIGLDVHDAGTYGTLRPGAVITIEPGIYIAPADDIDPKWWNIGVRIEDDVLITDAGPMNLSAGAPREVADIETLMR